MQRYVLVRIGQALIALLGMTLLVFLLVRLTGDPMDTMLGDWATEEQRQLVAKQWGLDQPWPVQYWVFLRNAMKGDFGRSFQMERPAMEIVMERFPATLQLGAVAMLVSILLALPCGVISAVKKDTIFDNGVKVVAMLGQSLPVFWLGLILMAIFAVALRLLPASGRGGLDHFILPGITLGWFVTAGIMRMVRSSMLDVLGCEYIKMARIKGLPERIVVWKHALRNALIPVVTFMGITFTALLAGSVVTETVFAWPGVGLLAVDSVMRRDFPVVQAIVILMTVLYLAMNLIVDILYAYVDPRIKY